MQLENISKFLELLTKSCIQIKMMDTDVFTFAVSALLHWYMCSLTWSEYMKLFEALVSAAQHTPALCWLPAAMLSGMYVGISSDEILPAPGGRGACISAENKCKVGTRGNSCRWLHRHLACEIVGKRNN